MKELIGSTWGHFTVTAKLGEGGMGEVYRATDGRLRREVAIKVLPAAFTADPERLARFEREAQLLAQLHHPNIASIFGLEEADGQRALVMELVEGEDLAARLARGPLPLDEALGIARQIAEALEAAHEKGIVHRDLKPQNVKLGADGRVKILDFGLAKAVDPGGGASAAGELARSPTLMNSPTLTAARGTQLGVILGTAAYMAPEQARGGAVDKRADIWAFGVVLWEMLAGERLFAGDSVVDTLSAVLRQPIDLTALPATTPPRLRELLQHCLERDPKRRLRDIGDARLALEEIAPPPAAAATGAPTRLAAALGRRRVLVPLAAALALLAGWALGRLTSPRPREMVTFQLLTHRRGAVTEARFAPDGQTIVYSAAWDGRPVDVYVGRVGSPDARALGLDGTALLAVSSRGEVAVSVGWRRTVGMETRGTLATVPLEGGAPRPLAEDVLAADWSPDGRELAVARFVGDECRLEYPLGTVLYKTTGWVGDVRISPDGGTVAFLAHPNRGDNLAVVSTVDRQRRVKTLSGQEFLMGLVWFGETGEIWSTSQSSGELRAYRVGREARTPLAYPGTSRIGDVARDGRILAIQSSTRREIFGRVPGSTEERRLSWFDWGFPRDLSVDGRTLLFEEQQLLGPDGYAIFVRGTDGSPAVRIGEGGAVALSPDGQFALVFHDAFGEHPKLVLIPTGAGEPRELADDGLRYQAWARFLLDGKSIVAYGQKPGQGIQLVRRSLSGPPDVRELSSAGLRLSQFGIVLSPSRDRVVVPELDGRLVVRSLADGSDATVPGTRPFDEAVAWSADGRAIYVASGAAIPLALDRLDLATGARSPWTTLAPADPAGVFRLGPVFVSRDERLVVYSFVRFADELFLLRGAR